MQKEILLIDDDQEDLELFCDALEEIDRSVGCRFFSGCIKALDFLKAGDLPLPICIFIDLSMPKIDGTACLKELKANSLLKDIPMFIVSGYITAAIKSNLSSLGAAGFIIKPDNFGTLKNEIASLISPLLGEDKDAA